jgi:hypothetical protein
MRIMEVTLAYTTTADFTLLLELDSVLLITYEKCHSQCRKPRHRF